jgi:hypothetical protein
VIENEKFGRCTAVIPGLTRNPENIENPGFPIEALGNDEKSAL